MYLPQQEERAAQSCRISQNLATLWQVVYTFLSGSEFGLNQARDVAPF
jgi:hypothetical protein